jgi:predicted RNA-binding protein YlxR (DUF448 family)
MRRIPQRTCIACRSVRSKRELVRIVCGPQGGLSVDETGKANGRGAYVCRSRLCWLKAIGDRRRQSNSRLGAELHTALTDDEWIALRDYGDRLPDGVIGEEEMLVVETKGGAHNAL